MMWVRGDEELPEALLQAQQEGRLVAFVGAGTSADAPSSLPLFVPLARQSAGEKHGFPGKRTRTITLAGSWDAWKTPAGTEGANETPEPVAQAGRYPAL